MEKCKSIEAKIELFKTLFEKFMLLFTLLGGGLGTLLVKYPQLHAYIIVSVVLLISIFGILLVILYLWGKEIVKLNLCEEEKE